MNDKEIKKKFKIKAQKEYKKYYPVNALNKLGFERNKCRKCGTYFWSTGKRNICDNAPCSGGFRFINDSPAKKKMGYIETWKSFSRLFKKLGYKEIKRYPVVSRWNPNTDFTIASIAAFQPFVVSGEVEPPANPLIIPQLCFRTVDIDNVGISGGAHYTLFCMVGQHTFMPPKKYDMNKYLEDIHTWLSKGLGLKNREITYHEDAWAGGGNFGSSMEFFSRGLELGNQVYMQFEKVNAKERELPIKVLDMGMGLERNAWFSQGSSTSYESTFPNVVKKLKEISGIKVDNNLMKRFLPYSSYLNIDEVDNIDKTWKFVAGKVSMDVKELKENVLPLAALYSIAEHSRALLVTINDGALPSNVGGFYNLRALLRRTLSFIDQYEWNVDLAEICKLHAAYLKPLFPELNKNLDEVVKILNVEKSKYNSTKQKTRHILKGLLKKEITGNKLLELYDSQGISPEIVREQAEKFGKEVKVPENFYVRVSNLHEKKEKKKWEERRELNLRGVKETEALYFGNYKKSEVVASVLKVIGKNVVLDKTIAYPTSGGQIHDIGSIKGNKILEVFKQGNVIIHLLKDKPKFKVGDKVKIKIDLERRKQLAQNHTATHIVNAAARKVLGNHINQAGAKKNVEKAHIDLTHYQSLSNDELSKIEKEANKIVSRKIAIKKSFMPRNKAEKRYGFSIYQGGVPIGKDLRIVDIKNLDVECCGGTHLDNTKEVGKIKILKSSKISDSVIRIEFVAGRAALKEISKESVLLKDVASLLKVSKNQVPGRAEEIFLLWKKVVKKKKDMVIEFKSTKKEKGSDMELLEKTATVLKTQPEFVINTLRRFLKELKEKKN